MILNRHRISFTVAFAAFAWLMITLLAYAIANAQGVDPVVVATTSTSDAWDLVAKHGPLGGGLIAYGLLAKFLAVNQTKHWLAEGRLLAILTGLSMVGGAAALWHFSGGPLEAVLEAVIGAIALIVKPTVTTVPAPVVTGPGASGAPA